MAQDFSSERSETRRLAVASTGITVLVLGLCGFTLITDILMPSMLKRRFDGVVAVWESPTAPAGWRQFLGLNASVVLTPPSDGVSSNSSNCSALSQAIPLTAAACPEDHYFEEADRFRSAKQLSFCAVAPDWSALQRCNVQVSFQIQQPGHDGPTTLTTISNAVGPTGRMKIDMGEIGKQFGCDASGSHSCSGTYYDTCSDRCEDNFGGSVSCDGRCSTRNVYVSSLAIKVQYNPGALPPYSLDTKSPGMGPDGWGANILPHGYTWTKPGASALSGPMWTYEGMSYGEPPSSLLLQIRSSSDPYLAYMAASKGNGSFDRLDMFSKVVSWIGLALGCLMFVLTVGCWCEVVKDNAMYTALVEAQSCNTKTRTAGAHDGVSDETNAKAASKATQEKEHGCGFVAIPMYPIIGQSCATSKTS